MTDRILAPLRVECAGRVREGLLAFGYTGEAGDVTPETPLGCLARAFAKHLPTPEEDLRRVLGDAFFAVCEEAGLWKRVADDVTGTVVLAADQGRFLLHDHGSERVGEMELYWVMGVGASTMQVAHAVPDKPYGRVLDLCCGSGIQAFRLAPFAKEIVAVDRNPRAVNLGQFGAALNGFPYVSFRESDFFSAVAGERFDAIVCNPPYVLSPEREKYYRDGGMEGDTLSEKVVREAGAYLTEGGCAYFVCDVATRHGVAAEDRLRGWVEGGGCDVLAIAAPAMSPLTAAALMAGIDPKPAGAAHASIVPYQVFACREGQVSLGVTNERIWARFCGAVGRPDWLADARYATNILRNANRRALLAELEPLFLTRTAMEWEGVLRAAEVPCAAVRTVAEALALPGVRSLWTLDDGLPVFGNPVRISGQESPLGPVPKRGEHTELLRMEFAG